MSLMLKVKDNIELKELEKYGFEYQTNWALKRYVKNNVYVFENNHLQSEEICKKNNFTFLKPRYLYIENDLFSNELVGLDEVVYDLIQADLIEKVEEQKMDKLFYCKRIINISKEIIQEYKPMNEEEFIQFSKQFINYKDFDADKYPYVFFHESHFMDDLDYIKEHNEEEWLLGNNPINNLGFEILMIEYK